MFKCMFAIFVIQLVVLQNSADELNINNNYRNMLVRLNDGHNATPNPTTRKGRVEVSFNNGRTWGTVCSTNWSRREGNVVCRQLGLGYASEADQHTLFGNTTKYPWGMVGTLCRGNEPSLAKCFREQTYPNACNAANRNIAVVQCVAQLADLELGIPDISSSAYLDSVPMNRLTCAMEENCVSRDAYVIRRTNPTAIRKLLRFTTKADNVGTADFSPYANHEQWEWHQCHRHYHSMKVFATFDIYTHQYEKVAQGHKASFCLMDLQCRRGVRPVYTCGNRTQGISIGCADLYYSGLDCQWVDVTTLQPNREYILRVAINPEYKIGEMSFENNGAECTLTYTGERTTTKVKNCRTVPLWFQR